MLRCCRLFLLAMALWGSFSASPGIAGPDTWTDPISGIEFVWVPGGCLDLGQTPAETAHLLAQTSETYFAEQYADEPRRRACPEGVWLARTETTLAQWKAVTGQPGKGCGAANSPRHPAVFLTQGEARRFAIQLTDLHAAAGSGERFALPEEAQWEKACRAGGEGPFPRGDSIGPDEAVYNQRYHYLEKTPQGGAAPASPLPGASRKANALGLYDLPGNVAEWMEDFYTTDGRPPALEEADAPRVLKGGTWQSKPRDLRCAARVGVSPRHASCDVGFRLARLAPGPR